MQRRRIRRVAAMLTMVAAATAAIALSPGAQAASGDNHSVFIYDASGLAVVGTMHRGNFEHVQTLDVGTGWTHAAVSADSLLLYNRGSGVVETGRLSGGMYAPVARRLAATRYTHLTASCDSYVLYNTFTGQREIGRLQSGVATPTTSGGGFSTGWDLMTASCDTIRFVRLTNGDESYRGAVTVLGYLIEGEFLQTMDYEESDHSDETKPAYTNLAMTSDQQLIYAADDPEGDYAVGRWNGAVKGGFGVEEGYDGGLSQNFSTQWDIISGTADALIFYDAQSGQTATATLDPDGTFTQRNLYGWSAGWDIIAGGK